MKEQDLDNHKYYTNRELSWLDFNNRVLEEALRRDNPLLERLKFLSITGSNLDEFYMIRVAGLKEQVEAEYTKKDISGLTPNEQLKKISEKTHIMVDKQYKCLMRALIPQLKSNNLIIKDISDLEKEEKKFLKKYFKSTIYPVITPMAVDQSRPFPLLPNKSINQAVRLQDENKIDYYAFLQVPSILPRFIELPNQDADKKSFILLDKVVQMFSERLFKGYEIIEMFPFRITRNADLSIDEEEAEDLLKEIESSLRQRQWGVPVRLELDKRASEEIKTFLLSMLDLKEEDIFYVSGPIDLSAWMSIATIDGFEELKYKPFKPVKSHFLYGDKDIFEVLKEKDILLHHPYETFDHVENFLSKAADDPNVLAIKQTLYRVSGDSTVVNTLIKAAENGKQVTVLVELKARFDEENNIQWAKKLEKAGCYVVYGLVGLKTHSKILLVVRKEPEGIKKYVHMSTGNYNDKTAKLYTDIGFMTSKEPYGSDASALFNVLTGYSQPPEWKKIAVAPISLKSRIINMIKNEIEIHKKTGKGHIIIKVNSLLDKEVIKVMYEASNAGVKLDLIVRGICALKPGIKGVSENITVRSIVGKFLEHSRIFYFSNGESPNIYMTSADLMPRNLERRIETLYPIEDENLQKETKKILDVMLSDTEKARVLQPDGTYRRVDRRGKKRVDSQEYFIKMYEKLLKSKRNTEKIEILSPISKPE
ncbi:RNA degradosome polyphosphate kinase [Geotoga petraea]|jgi:polyphosphate kinase|uniref:Polyphosphate kinase n=1 Tax=Geotoga petraea TaxID=28234 RepID=A0A1G6LYI9_9BACT|nr:RNA degradosome polyphosphate kinase [Geotoga petraea]MDK2945772.1 polyphosphate kinase [Geotoga sp.]TGG87573.1 RNA degradosome polyphosphate kinase [Geotoga petraea]SDC47795.1 polyphosphate kinase [Geotoga petraea]